MGRNREDEELARRAAAEEARRRAEEEREEEENLAEISRLAELSGEPLDETPAECAFDPSGTQPGDFCIVHRSYECP